MVVNYRYVGSPDMLTQISPEMDSIVDRVLGLTTAAGIRLGMTLRPQKLTLSPRWSSSVPPKSKPQKYFQFDFYNADNTTDVQAYVDNIVHKASYAIKRWNASMFYVDTCGNKNGVLPHAVWDGVTKALPGVLFFPEETTLLDYAVVQPLQDNWPSAAKGIHAVPAAAKYMWPGAANFQLLQFSLANNTAGMSVQCRKRRAASYQSARLLTGSSFAYAADFVPLVREGDALRADAWYNNSEAWDIVREAYLQA